MKGFYFSLDSLLAASIILAVMMMLINYDEPRALQEEKVGLDLLQTSSIQEVSNWNNSYPSSQAVMDYIYRRHYQGDNSEAGAVCRQYFETESPSSLFMGDDAGYQKICGGYEIEDSQDTVSSSLVLPSIEVNGSLIGPKEAVLVIEN